MELNPRYKRIEEGAISEEWELKRIGDHVTFLRNGVHSRAELTYDDPVKCLHYGDIHSCSSATLDPESLPSLPSSKAKNLDRLRDGDLVFADASEDLVGVSKSVEICGASKTEVVSGLHTIAARFDKNTLKDGFKSYLQFCPEFYSQLRRLAAGTKVYATKRSHIASVLMRLPSIYEQQIIATVLSDTDALLDGLDQLIAKKRDLKQAAMQQLLTGKTRLPGFEGEWEYRSLVEITEFQKSNFQDGDWIEAEHITDSGIRLIQTGNIGIGSFIEKEVRKFIYEDSFTKLRCKELRVGDILICRLAEPAGRACIFPNIGEERAITSVDVTIFRPREEIANRNFIVQYCSTNNWFKSVLNSVGGTTHRRISRGALGKLLIPFPSIEEQAAIATVLSDMDDEIAALEQRRAKTKEIKQGMMQELLTGKTRLMTPRESNA